MIRIVALAAGGLVLAAVFMVAYVRSADTDHRRWHVNPLTAERTGKPNEFVVMPPGHGGGDMESPIFDMTPRQLEHKLAAVVAQEPRTRLIAGDRDEGFLTYIARSEWIGFPDYITLLIEPMGQGQSALAVWSRSRFGYSDLGVNEARVRRWLEALQS